MINPFTEVNWNPDTGERRKFARSLMIGFPCLAAAFLLIGWVKTGAGNGYLSLALWLAGAGAGAGLVFFLVPAIAKPFYRIWYFLACCIGIVVSNLLLGGFYFLVLTLFGVVRRAFHPRAFPKSYDKQAATYWRDVEPAKDAGRYYKQF
jgi:hypothetical protein